MGGSGDETVWYFVWLVIINLSVLSCSNQTNRASKAKIQRLEKELAEYEKTKESLRHYQAKVTELEKTTKKQNKQAHTDKREIIRLKEEVELLKTKVRTEGGWGMSLSCDIFLFFRLVDLSEEGLLRCL